VGHTIKMTEGPGKHEHRRRFFHPRVADNIIAVAAVFVSGVSLWIGVRTENANEELVQGSTWPFAQVEVSNADPDGGPNLQFEVMNTGVGPAKIESFELFWKGRPFRTGQELLEQCCGYKTVPVTAPETVHHTILLSGTVEGIVLRAGDTRAFIRYRLNPNDVAIWKALNTARDQITYRICYCSVLDQCWRTVLGSELHPSGGLHPEVVNKCPVPAVAFTD
jgi:hypothetical protein